MNKEKYLDGLLRNEQGVIRIIYREFLPGVISHVKKNRGSSDEARDVFQDALMIIYEKAKQPHFELQEGFGQYLFGICRFLWLRQLKKKQRTPITSAGEAAHSTDREWEELQLEEEKQRLYQKHFARLGKDCQQVLQLFFNGNSLADIATKMGYSKSYSKLKKFQCKERLTKWVKGDSQYKAVMLS